MSSPEMRAWSAMKQRCLNPRHPRWSDYGGRGITVCKRWMEFQNFNADMGSRPSPQHSLDRIDNDGGYEPGNCRWATIAQQMASRRPRKRIRFAHHDGVCRSLVEWSSITGIPYTTLCRRARAGRDLFDPAFLHRRAS